MPYADVHQHGFLGLSILGWGGFLLLWVLQAFVFWNGMETIKRFIDVAGPAVYVVMFVLAGYMVYKAGWQNISLNLGEVSWAGRVTGDDDGNFIGRFLFLRANAQFWRFFTLLRHHEGGKTWELLGFAD
jgi:cytosine/uracil/thiamine/allantoin permease